MQEQPDINVYRLERWRDFYSRHFSLKAEFSLDIIPPTRPGFDRLIVVVPGIHPDKVIRSMRLHFYVKTDVSDINRIIISNERKGSECPYAIWAKEEDHPDWPYEKKSADWVNSQVIHTETLLEYLLHFYKGWDETRRIMNYQTNMICTGTQIINNGSPRLRYDQSKEQLEILWFPRDLELGNMNPREVIVQPRDVTLKSV